MNVFDLRDRVLGEYEAYVRSFIQIRDERIRAKVDEEMASGLLWPEPRIGLNPSFAIGPSIGELVKGNELHAECESIFQIKTKSGASGKPLRLYQHQVEGIRAARANRNYVLTTGTGSGKSLAYIVPIVDHVLRNGSGKGIKAVIVYPMNALANSQFGELEKFIDWGYGEGRSPVKFAKYTGQQDDEARNAILADPPDILLTNYVMLELILTRVFERRLVEHMQGLRFLVLDELHTYRGRQGADVALLVRRVRDACSASELQCIGTSATLASIGSRAEQQDQIAQVGSLLFGAAVEPNDVISETLRRVTPERDITDDRLADQLRQELENTSSSAGGSPEEFSEMALSTWIESILGVARSDEGDERLVRAQPSSIGGAGGAAERLQTVTGLSQEVCERGIRQQLLAGSTLKREDDGSPVFAFRLHQFLSRGETVYATLESEDSRYLTVNAQQFSPGDRSRVLFPFVFCRECGQEYYSVAKDDSNGGSFAPRPPDARGDDDAGDPGYLFLDSLKPWPAELDGMTELVPDDWLEEGRDGPRVKRDLVKRLPFPLRLQPDGSPAEDGILLHFVPSPFRFCLRCGVGYPGSQKNDFAKLGTLGSEGRSTATTVLSLATLRAMKTQEMDPTARKLLAFTDNRQDAALQAGHFNDFVEVGLMRSALFRAVDAAGSSGLRHEELGQRVFESLNLDFDEYAADPDLLYAAAEDVKRVLREVLSYRIYRDQRRGWRITSPNLEQCGLLKIDYESLDELCRDDAVWAGSHELLNRASPSQRADVATTLLDHMRRELAIKVDFLGNDFLERLKQSSSQRLRTPWALDPYENLEYATILFPRSRAASDFRGFLFLSSRSGFGRYLRRPGVLLEAGEKLKLDETADVIRDLLKGLARAGLVQEVVAPRSEDDVPGYQLPAAAMIWRTANGTKTFHDPIRTSQASVAGAPPNPFFVDLYRNVAAAAGRLEAQDHTAQVPYEVREELERRFRSADLPLLFCSPTMELGVDISDLNAVALRNVPPTPANYAQRSGRAGRQGQPALVTTYCSTGSPHDQYYFRRQKMMVAGQVSPPRLDLANEDLVRAHVYAIWLAESGLHLGSSLKDLLDLGHTGSEPRLLQDVEEKVEDHAARARAKTRAAAVLDTISNELAASAWYRPEWLEDTVQAVGLTFRQACQRWWELYRSALAQVDAQTKVITDHSRPMSDKNEAKRLRREAEAQLELLTAEKSNVVQSDFYSYRYFAGEGFLPGYNFPRLPLSAFIPGSRGRKGEDGFVSRPRFLAISEFGPRNFIYYGGSSYVINRVILPLREAADTGESPLALQSIKQCSKCGYIHPIGTGAGPDICERCKADLEGPLTRLFRLQNVATQRRQRISSDEEERRRYGFEIRTGVRFPEDKGQPLFQTAEVMLDDQPVATLTYGPTATIWRINVGWRHRANREQLGFVVDVERGYWQRSEQEAAPGEGEADPMSKRTERVIPYVEDRRNALILEPAQSLGETELASLESALRVAIQAVFQLEDGELASEPLPSRNDRRSLLLYEASEGGAGVLRRLVEDPTVLSTVAAKALDICHFDPQSGIDLKYPPGGTEECMAACYDCLMSYSNQRDHRVLDRKSINGLLVELASSRVIAAPGPRNREEHLEALKALTMSDLEKRWLDFINVGGFRLPDESNPRLDGAGSPDFLYVSGAAIYVDGPFHEYPTRAERDREKEVATKDLGYTVIRFPANDDWEKIIQAHPWVFGSGDRAKW